MKLKIGIVGYGNLGHAVEKEIYSSDKYKLIAIFSRRNVKSKFLTPIKNYGKINDYIGKIDIMIMCGGSKNDLMWQSAEVLQNFNIIDTFDTHELISKHSSNLDKIAKNNDHVAIYSCGWDPGLFSLYKLLGNTILQGKTNVFWGKGVSQGHSDALRQIPGVVDAIQYTIPDPKIVKLATNKNYNIFPNQKHLRVCYVAVDNEDIKNRVEKEIRNMPYYFKDQRVEIYFSSPKEISKLKEKMYHAGKVISIDENNLIINEVKMSSNPQFTAKILLAFINAIPKMKCGAYSILDIPPSYINKDYLSCL